MQFFLLERPNVIGEATTDYTIAEPSESGPASRCRMCGEYVEMLHWLPPHQVELKFFGTRPADFVFGGAIDVLVSERFRNQYRAENLSGFEGFDPVQVIKARSKGQTRVGQIPNYYHVRAGRSRAKINDEASGIIREGIPNCSECGGGGVVIAKRIILEEGTWNGEDVFSPRGLPGTILVTSRIVDIYKSNALEGADFIPALDYKYERYGFSH